MKSHLRAGRVMAVVFGASLLVSATGGLPVSADTCASTTVCAGLAVGQVVASASAAPSDSGTVTGAVTRAVDATTGTAADAVSGTTDQVADAVSDAGAAVPAPADTVTDPALDDVAGALPTAPSDTAPATVDAAGSGGDRGAAGGSGTAGGRNGSSALPPPTHERPAVRPVVHHIGSRPIAARRGDAVPATSDATGRPLLRSVPRPIRPEHASAIDRVARALRFPVLLLVAILLFVTFQHRVDRRAPKLVHAPIDAGQDSRAFG